MAKSHRARSDHRVLVQAVKGNIRCFSAVFMFQLFNAEWTVLRSRTVIPTCSRGSHRFAPYVFTKQGIAMLSSVLGSERAIAINIEIMRASVKLRELLVSNKELAQRGASEQKLTEHDRAISAILRSPPLFLEYVEIWNMHLAKAISGEVISELEHGEEKIKPFYEHLEQRMQQLQDEIAQG